MSETVMLIKVDGNENNNKFYELTELADGQVQARWGRVGADGVSKVYPRGSFQTKLQEKIRKGYERFGTSTAPTGSRQQNRPVQGVEPRLVRSLFGAAKIVGADKLVASLLSNNRHAISGITDGKIKVSSSGAVTTALGPVTTAQITEARKLLDDIASHLGSVRMSVRERYLTLIPQPVKRVADDSWLTSWWVASQRDLLDALDTAVKISATDKDGEKDNDSNIPFRHKMSLLDSNSDEFTEIEKMYSGSKNANHGSASRKLLRVWKLDDQETKNWDASKTELKHHRQLWHGTTAGNVLSILRTGLFCPPSSDSRYATTGRMFGDGVYFSDQSTKSLNYACGTWSRDIGSGNPMMFLADVVMGRECRSTPTSSSYDITRTARTGRDEKGRKYSSLFIRGGHCSVRNNEMIVWDDKQIKLIYLCEFSK